MGRGSSRRAICQLGLEAMIRGDTSGTDPFFTLFGQSSVAAASASIQVRKAQIRGSSAMPFKQYIM